MSTQIYFLTSSNIIYSCTQWRSQDMPQGGGKPLSVIIGENKTKFIIKVLKIISNFLLKIFNIFWIFAPKVLIFFEFLLKVFNIFWFFVKNFQYFLKFCNKIFKMISVILNFSKITLFKYRWIKFDWSLTQFLKIFKFCYEFSIFFELLP